MLTKEKILLLASAKIIEQMRFEAIEQIFDLSAVPNVWAHNKTPIMFKDIYEGSAYNILIVPDELIHDNPENDFIEFCHVHGIECGEVISHQSFEISKSGCFLCEEANLEVNGKKCSNITEFNMLTEINNIIIYETEHFFVKIELGCFIEGMLMINPKKHIYSMAMNPDEYFEEYELVKKHVQELLKATYGEDKPVIFFEHGSAPTGYSSHASSIVHAHTHVAIGHKFSQEHIDAVQLRPVQDIRTLKKSKYMSYQVGYNGEFMAVNDPAVYVQRQYPRQVLAEIVGIKNWNWRFNPCMENIKKTFDALYETFANSTTLDPLIVERCDGFIQGYPARKN